MARGVIYVMTTVVPGLVKIGKAGTDNFERRMYDLEHNGYCNVTGLRRAFAIEVDDYDEKESMLDDIFARSNITNSELFALDVDLVMQLLASFEGRQVYPKVETKEQVFEHATEERTRHLETGVVPDGEYHMVRKMKRLGGTTYEADMVVTGGRYVIRAGTRVCPEEGAGLSSGIKQLRERFVEDGITTEDVEFRSPSGACSFVIGASADGWANWVTPDGRYINVYRQGE